MPQCPGSNSHAFTLRLEPDGEHGAEDAGSLYDLAKKLGIALPQRTEVSSTKRAYRDLADYAEAHGINEEILSEAGWRFTMKDGRPALEFTTRTGSRYRFIDGDKPTYKSPVQYQRCWYGLDRASKFANATPQPLIICNGEISTVVAQAYGIAACAVTGGEKKSFPPDLIDSLIAARQRKSRSPSTTKFATPP